MINVSCMERDFHREKIKFLMGWSEMTAYTKESQLKEDPVRLVKKSYVVGFFLSVLIAILAYYSATYINQYHLLSDLWIKGIQIFSVAIEAAAMFGVQGWERGIQTWERESKPEKLSQRLFKIFSATGFFLVIFSFQLIP